MSALQVRIDDVLKGKLKQQADRYGISTSALVRIILTNALDEQFVEGNIFNADRDNNGVGIRATDFLKMF